MFKIYMPTKTEDILLISTENVIFPAKMVYCPILKVKRLRKLR
jgi:hypothetical protein